MKTRFANRRDQCHYVGKRALRLTKAQAACAWEIMAIFIEDLGEKDLPKYRDLITAVRMATIIGHVQGRDDT